eukprot:CAMPEP_0202386454 /NCGR_PEP_ID=MMETSP1127-20130417/66521_1 /ASSEMBLY_ACC=CAM_ASM_000462 /TAXON_ID=3047 /ORGANISM="Dunaliella tertiolecta, Strain CCMP1320" /LENGTH=44 /DNA_ID= /DNA_START= /DNA_END= /DNA_ORIENTATION=
MPAALVAFSCSLAMALLVMSYFLATASMGTSLMTSCSTSATKNL